MASSWEAAKFETSMHRFVLVREEGFGVALSPYNLVTALCGTLIGTVVGLLPGLGPINGVALLIPIAFALGLPPESALILLAAAIAFRRRGR